MTKFQIALAAVLMTTAFYGLVNSVTDRAEFIGATMLTVFIIGLFVFVVVAL